MKGVTNLKTSRILLCALLIICFSSYAYAEALLPYADLNAAKANILVHSNGKVYISVAANYVASSISVHSCTIEYDDNGVWRTLTSVAVPGYIENSRSFSTNIDCNAIFESGYTYRAVVRFNISGFITNTFTSAGRCM